MTTRPPGAWMWWVAVLAAACPPRRTPLLLHCPSRVPPPLHFLQDAAPASLARSQSAGELSSLGELGARDNWADGPAPTSGTRTQEEAARPQRTLRSTSVGSSGGGEVLPYRLQAVGHSLGAACLLQYAVLCGMRGQPQRIRRLILMSPAGFHSKVPLVGAGSWELSRLLGAQFQGHTPRSCAALLSLRALPASSFPAAGHAAAGLPDAAAGVGGGAGAPRRGHRAAPAQPTPEARHFQAGAGHAARAGAAGSGLRRLPRPDQRGRVAVAGGGAAAPLQRRLDARAVAALRGAVWAVGAGPELPAV